MTVLDFKSKLLPNIGKLGKWGKFLCLKPFPCFRALVLSEMTPDVRHLKVGKNDF